MVTRAPTAEVTVPDVDFMNLLAVMVIALGAPLLLGLAPALRMPAVVLEILAGVVFGPSVLGWVETDLVVEVLALLGLAFLLFLAGLEIDVHRLRDRLLRLAVFGDSFTHCDEITYQNCWTSRLESLWPNTEVLNFGVPGFGPDQAWLRYQRDGRGCKRRGAPG